MLTVHSFRAFWRPNVIYLSEDILRSLCSQKFCPSNEEEKKKQKQNIIIACKLMQINTMIQTTERRGVKM